MTKSTKEMKITDSKLNICVSVIFLVGAIQCFIGHSPAAPIEGGGELPHLEKWQLIVGGISMLGVSLFLLIKR
jgi:hypothetical protein